MRIDGLPLRGQSILLCSFAGGGAAYGAAGETGHWRAVVGAVVFDVEAAVGGCFVDFDYDWVAVAFVAAGEAADGGAAACCAGGVDVAVPQALSGELERINA